MEPRYLPRVRRRNSTRSSRTGGTYRSGFDRTDSGVFLAHSFLNWFANGFWALFIMLKLEGDMKVSWWVVFYPRWFSGFFFVPLQVAVIYCTKELVEKQIGPPPSDGAPASLRVHYTHHCWLRQRSHVVRNVVSLVDSVAQLVVLMVFCSRLEAVEERNQEWGSFRTMFIPFWISWILVAMINLLKDKSERGYGSYHELQYLFLLCVACKLDNVNSYSWKLVFLIPWMCFVIMYCVACLVLFLLVSTKSPVRERVLQIGILLMFLSFIPQNLSYVKLVSLLDGDAHVSVADVMVPNIASWFMLFVSSIVMWLGLKHQEASRSRWMIVQRMMLDSRRDEDPAGVELGVALAAEPSVLDMTEEGVMCAAEELAQGKVKPVELYRVSASLFRRVAAGTSPVEHGGSESSVSSSAGPARESPSSVRDDKTVLGEGAGRRDPEAGSYDSEDEEGDCAACTLPQLSAFHYGCNDAQGSSSSSIPAGGSLVESGTVLLEIREGGVGELDDNDIQWNMATRSLPFNMLRRAQEAMSPRKSSDSADIVGSHEYPEIGTPKMDEEGMADMRSDTDGDTLDVGLPTQEPAHLQTFAMEAESDDFDSPLSTRGHNKSLDVESLPRSEKGNARLQQASQRKTRSGTSDSSTSAFMGGGLNGNPPQSGTSTDALAVASEDINIEDDDSDMCMICCDNLANCVFLECGHGGVCKKCAYLIWVRPPHECPSCRSKIDQVVELEVEMSTFGRVGRKRVKQ